MNFHYCWLVCLLLLNLNARAQEYPIVQYTNHDGLPQMQVMSIFGDSRGVLWIGTKHGVSRYNGNQFDNLSPAQLQGGQILSMAEDAAGNLWFTFDFEHGSTRYDGKTFRYFDQLTARFEADHQKQLWCIKDGQLARLQHDSLAFLPPFSALGGKPITALIADRPNRRLLIGVDGVGLFAWQNDRLTRLPVPFANTFGNFDNGVVVHHPDWPVLSIVDPKGRQYNYCVSGTELLPFIERLASSDTFKLLRPVPRDYFIRHKGKTYIVERNTLTARFVMPSFGYSPTYCALGEHLFVGTEQGLYRLTNNGFRYFTNQQAPYVWSVVEDRKNDIWWLSYRHQARRWSNGSVQPIKRYTVNDNWYFGSLRSSLNGDLYLAHNDGVVRTDGRQFRLLPDTNQIRVTWDLFEDPRRKLLLQATRGAVNVFQNDRLIRRIELFKGLPHVREVFAVAEDTQHHYWMAGGYGVWRYDWESQQLKKYLNIEKRFPHKNALSLCTDKWGTVWAGTEKGLLYLDARADTFRTVAPHLIQSMVLYLDVAGRYLMAGDLKTLYALDLETFHRTGKVVAKGFNQHNGFLGIEPGQNGFYQDSKKRVWIPSGTVLSYLELDKLSFATSPLRVAIRAVNDTLLPFHDLPDSVFSLDRNLRTAKIQFEAIGFDRWEHTTFSWQLDDGPWSDWLSTEVAYLTDLAPGKHVFRVKTRRNSQTGNTEPMAALTFRANLPFWKHPLVPYVSLLAFTGLLGLGGYLFFRDRRNGLRLQQQEQQLLFLQVQTLQAQLNPHFVFNVLGTLQKMIMTNDLDSANLSLVRLAQLIRSFLESSVRSELIKSRSTDMEVKLDKELELLKLYVEFEHLQYRDRFTYQFIVDPTLVTSMWSVPAMLVQPFVENAIKHGLLYKDDPGHLLIRVRREADEMLLFIIEDDGVGRETAGQLQAKSIKPYISRGSDLVKKRIDVLNRLGYAIHLTINDRPGGGTVVRLLIDHNGLI
jgi:hypothetical protein